MISAVYAQGSAAAQAAYGTKLADVSFSLGIPGLGVTTQARDERLPGMERWVPRDYLERAYQSYAEGVDPSYDIEQAAAEGRALHPAIGGAVGAGIGRYLHPQSGVGAPALGALLGSGVGALYNTMTAEDRARNMAEASRGVYAEKARQKIPSAHSPVPKVVSGASAS